ncbi:MAG: SDR family oxidoreductase [Sulfurovum sp.]|nr:SDR family oxidoreductase [Sulfurovum sp.]
MNLSKLKNKKIAILGIGYIGSNILNYLKSLDINLHITVITKKNLDIIEKNEFDYLINSSGNSGDFRTQLIETIDSNLGLNSYILEKAKIKESYIYISSSRVYGFTNENNIIFNEDSTNCYNNLDLDFIYDGSKKLAESLLYNYSKDLDYKIGILRLSNVYGKFNNFDDSTLIKKIIRYKQENKKSLFIKQNRNSMKDYIYIDDVVESIITVMLNIKNTDIYNLAYGKSYSLDEVSKFLNLKIETDDNIEPIYSNVSNEKLSKEFGIKLKYSLMDGLENNFKRTIDGCD